MVISASFLKGFCFILEFDMEFLRVLWDKSKRVIDL